MKKFAPVGLWLAIIGIGLFYMTAFAQVIPTIPVPPPVLVPADPNQEFLSLLIQSIGGLKGMGTLGIVGVAIQLLLKLANTSWIKLDGGVKLAIVSGLGLVGGVVALMSPPNLLTLGAALVHSATLTAFMVFFNQVYQQWLAPKPKTI